MSSRDKCGLGSLDEDSVAHILSYLDFASALYWKEVVDDDDTSLLLTDFGRYGVVWRETVRRQGFAPPFATKQDVNATIAECLYRKQLELNLFGKSGTTTTATATSNLNSLSALPNRLYSFLPITPEEWDDLDDDAPPVPFSCDCFALTSASVGGEFLLLNPFSQSLTVYDSLSLENHHQVGQTTSNNPVLQKVERQHEHDDDEEALASAVQQATLSSPRKGSLGSETEGNSSQEEDNHDMEDEPNEDDIDNVEMAHMHHHRPRPRLPTPLETLISWQDDVLDVDLFRFFWPTPNDDDDELGNDDEVQVEVEYMGVDSKQIFQETEFMGTLLAVGRVLHSETPVLTRRHQGRVQQTSRDCFEILTWFRQHNHTTEWKSAPKICRAQGCFDLVEIGNFCIFVTLAPNDDNQDETDNDAQEWNRNERSSKVFVYRLLDYDPSKLDPVQDNDSMEEEEPSMTYFPQPTCRLDCKEGVSAMAACATGDHLVAFTQQGKLLVWKRTGESFILQQETRFLKALKKAMGKDRWSPRFQAETRSPVISVHCPPGAPIELCGFCTLHRSRSRGSTIFLWHHHHHGDKTNGGKKWRVESMIQLPLNAHRIPKVHYDGRRLIVFGQDHIGLILLVYEVAGTCEQLATYQRETTSSLGQQLDGNVYDLTETKRVRFVSRIRHAALDGVEDYENLYMSCNERYIVVNTKTAHMLSEGAQPFREGLLVIDLNDQPF